MQRSRRRRRLEEPRRYETREHEVALYRDFYRQNPYWQMIAGILDAEDKANATNDNQPTLTVDGGE